LPKMHSGMRMIVAAPARVVMDVLVFMLA